MAQWSGNDGIMLRNSAELAWHAQPKTRSPTIEFFADGKPLDFPSLLQREWFQNPRDVLGFKGRACAACERKGVVRDILWYHRWYQNKEPVIFLHVVHVYSVCCL